MRQDPPGYPMKLLVYPLKLKKAFRWQFLGANQDKLGQWWMCWRCAPNESVCFRPDVGKA